MRFFVGRRRVLEPSLPVLQTERLVLRCFDPNDAVDVYAFAQNPAVGLMAGWQPHQSVEESRKWIEDKLQGGHTWAIVEKRTGRVIGSISLEADVRRPTVKNAYELSYALGEECWGNGYATEACREVMRCAFAERECVVISVAHFTLNNKSKRVIKKLGFVFEGILRSAHTMPDGSLSDLATYSMAAQEYSAIFGK